MMDTFLMIVGAVLLFFGCAGFHFLTTIEDPAGFWWGWRRVAVVLVFVGWALLFVGGLFWGASLLDKAKQEVVAPEGDARPPAVRE